MSARVGGYTRVRGLFMRTGCCGWRYSAVLKRAARRQPLIAVFQLLTVSATSSGGLGSEESRAMISAAR